MDCGDEVAPSEPQDQSMELGDDENTLPVKESSEKTKRKRADETDEEDNSESGSDEESSSSSSSSSDDDDEPENSEYNSLPPLKVPLPVKGGKKPVGKKQAMAATPSLSASKAKGQPPRSTEAGVNKEPVDIPVVDTLGSDHEGEINIKNTEPESPNVKGKKRKIAGSATPKKPPAPKAKRTTNPSNKKTSQTPTLTPESLPNKKAGIQKNTFMTKKEAGFIFDMAIESANWASITSELSKMKGASILSKNLKRHFTTILKKQALSGYDD